MFASAAYESLEPNFIRDLMELSDQPWKNDASLFPKRELIEEYLQTYSTGLHVEYDTEVIDIIGRSAIQPNEWRVRTKKCDSKVQVDHDFDAIVMAVGTFDKPNMPDFMGLEEWKKMHSGSVSHARTYRDTEEYRGKNVVVIGNRASGLDISLQLATVTKNLWVSSTRASRRSHEKAIPVKGILRLVPEKRLVEFEDNEEAREVDKILFCTGYMYNTPFLRKGKNARTSLFPTALRMDDLYEHIFWTKRPTLSFVGVPKNGPTFLISQAQSAVIARCLSSKLVPKAKVMSDWTENEKIRYKERAKDNETTEGIHDMPYPICKEYIGRLQEWFWEIDEAASNKAPEGNQPFQWKDRLDWIMQNNRDIRRAFTEKGPERHSFTSPESLGFVETNES
ncbi:FAD/NAD(P)-binding domain-containing protein [Xylariaceae sp. FL0662B]|nr:FAD/NAD(P)-binding domain-containing protein [Xylariaceae sp. FL0662B]